MATLPSVPTFTFQQDPSIAVLNQLAYCVTFLNTLPAYYSNSHSGQTLTTGVAAALTWSTPSTDRDSGWAAGNPTRYTAQTPGYYNMSALVALSTGAAGAAQCWFKFTTGPNNPGGAGLSSAFGGTAPAISNVDQVTLGAQTPYLYLLDYVEVWVAQNSGGNLTTGTCTWQAALNGLGP